MANIHLKQAHEYSKDEARERVEGIAKDLKQKLKADYQWKGDSLQFKRSGASGSIDLCDGFIEVNVKLGLVLTPVKGTIEESIKENLRTFLA